MIGTKYCRRVDSCMLEDIEDIDRETEPLSLPDYDEEKLRKQKREELADCLDEELRAELARMDEEEREWCDRFGVDGPDEIEDSISSEMDADKRRERRRVVYYWRQNRHIRQMIEQVLAGD